MTPYSQVLSYMAAYCVSAALGFAISRHALADWASAYRENRAIDQLTSWHPVLAAQWLWQGRPRSAPELSNWRAMLAWSFVPLLNTIFVSTYLACLSLDWLMSRTQRASLMRR